MADSEAGIGGEHTRSIASSKTGVTADTSSVRSITTAFNSLTQAIKKARAEFQGLISDATKAGTSVAGAVSTSTPSGGPKTVGKLKSTTIGAPGSSVPSTSGPPEAGGFMSKIKGIGGAIAESSGTSKGSIVAGAFAAATSIASKGVQLADRRIDENMAYALPADRLSMVQQQMTGMSQNQVANNLRKPLTNYKLGDGGLNALLSNQVRYGIDAGKQAAGYEAMRAATGYSVSTQDLVGMQNSLMGPQVANRMFALTGGTNFNKMGGGAADMFQSFQKIGKMSGLGNEKTLKGAFQQGSAVRANLSNLGLDAQAQDLMLQYAQENIQFKKKGGKGDYDPSKKADRKRMGVEDNFANQSEETKRVQGQREENMYRRQADNYSKLEKSNQSLIKALGKVEDKLSGLIGARANTRGFQQALGGIGKFVGNAMGTAGAAMSFIAPEIGIPLALAGGVVSGVSSVATGGDGAPANPADVSTATAGSSSTADPGSVSPVPSASPAPAATPSAQPTPTPPANSASAANDDNISIPVGWKNETKTLTQLKSWSTFAQLKPILKERLLKAFREHPALGIGEGWRSSATQERTFLDRYRKTATKTKDTVEWQGSNWIKVKGADAAPPGKSMHEIGLAADLKGDLNWWQSNAARFGLKTFANENSEPWHTQPSEFPAGRGEYEKGVAKGTYADGSTDSPLPKEATAGSPPAISITDGANVAGTTSSPNPLSTGRGNLGLTLDRGRVRPRLSLGEAMGSGGNSQGQNTLAGTSSGASPAPTGASLSIPKDGTMTPAQIAQVAFNAGFRGKDLTTMVAVALRESRGHPSSMNMDNTTKDQSYGLWQINMRPEALGPLMTKLGYTGSQLLDPNIAAKAAFAVYSKRGGSAKGDKALYDWLGYKPENGIDSPAIQKQMPLAIDGVKQAGFNSGDPMPIQNLPVGGTPVSSSRVSVSGDPMPRSSGNMAPPSSGNSTVHINSSPSITMPMNFTFQGVPADVDIRKIANQVRDAIKSELDTELLRTR